MSAAAFYVLGAVVVGAALLAVGMPRAREAAAALLLLTTAAGILAIVSGAYVTGVLEATLPALAVISAALAIRRSGHAEMQRQESWSRRTVAIAAAASLAVLVVLLIAFAGNASSWHAGSGGAPLLTLLHYRAPFALVAALVALAVGMAGAFLAGRRSDDEREYDRTHEARRLREERTQRRRDDREAARRRRRGPAGSPP